MTKVKSDKGQERTHNEAICLYDMNADEMLHQTGHVVVDSSLGTIVDPLRARRRGQITTQDH